MKFLIAFILIVCICMPAHSQDNGDKKSMAVSFGEKGLRVSVRPAVAGKARVDWNRIYNPRANNFISLGAGVDYLFPVAKDLSVVAGIHGLWHGSNFSFYVAGTAFQPPLDFDLDHRGKTSGGLENGLISAQIRIEKRWWDRYRNAWTLGIGAALNDCATSEVETSYSAYQNGQWIQYAYLFYNAQNGGKPFMSANLMAGRWWKIGNRQCFMTSIVADYSFSYFAKGYYTIQPPGKPEIRGNYKIDGSYLGIDFAYVIPKKLRTKN
jgi:hypothetical protein